jgi:hypothetical protein
MTRFLIVLFCVVFGGFAMARDGSYQSRLHTVEPSPTPTDDLDAFFQTEEGQVAKAMLDAIGRGDREEAKRIYQEGQAKYGWTPRNHQQQKPARKPLPPQFNVPMTLPPEAR